MALRVSDTFRINKWLRVGGSIGTNGRPRVWATEKVGRFRITESTGASKRRRKR